MVGVADPTLTGKPFRSEGGRGRTWIGGVLERLRWVEGGEHAAKRVIGRGQGLGGAMSEPRFEEVWKLAISIIDGFRAMRHDACSPGLTGQKRQS